MDKAAIAAKLSGEIALELFIRLHPHAVEEEFPVVFDYTTRLFILGRLAAHVMDPKVTDLADREERANITPEMRALLASAVQGESDTMEAMLATSDDNAEEIEAAEAETLPLSAEDYEEYAKDPFNLAAQEACKAAIPVERRAFASEKRVALGKHKRLDPVLLDCAWGVPVSDGRMRKAKKAKKNI